MWASTLAALAQVPIDRADADSGAYLGALGWDCSSLFGEGCCDGDGNPRDGSDQLLIAELAADIAM